MASAAVGSLQILPLYSCGFERWSFCIWSIVSLCSLYPERGIRDTRHLMLDLDAVEAGLDRDVLMVRTSRTSTRIANVVDRVLENGHGQE
jgi:hypothetical protein